MSQSTSDQRRPFLSAPSPKRYFAAAPIEEARQRIVRAIARSEGPAILVGGAGTGKSLLLAVLAEQFAPHVSVVTLGGAQLCTRKALLQMILCELGLPYRGMDEGELRLSILEHLRGAGGEPAPMLLLVDEADALPLRLLEELRVLTNVAADGLPLVSLVLAGGPILEERFADPQLDMFAQRIAARCYLAPLSREETLQYVRSQVAAVGVRPEKLFTADALEAIHSATGGVPRLINQLGDQLAWMAEETGCAPLDAALVQQAWSELQQLPAPWNTHDSAAASASTAGVVEFGELDGLTSEVIEHPRRADSQQFHAAANDDADDEHPASIPIAAGRSNFAMATLAEDEFAATIEATEHLLESFDEFDGLEIRAADPPPGEVAAATGHAEEPDPPSAENPFDEPFDEEEIVLDPYAAFESELLRTAPQVINRLDRAFAGELHRCVQRAATAKSAAPAPDEDVDASTVGWHGLGGPPTWPCVTGSSHAHEDEGMPRLSPAGAAISAQPAPVRLHDLAAQLPAFPDATRDLLVIEDDDCAATTIVPGRQFRRLFSALETACGRSRSG